MLTLTHILDAIQAPPTALNRGRVDYLRKTHGHRATPAQRKFLEDMTALPVVQKTRYQHPEDTVRGAVVTHTKLEPSDLLWLQRLPTDPAAVSFDDAATVAAMHAGISRKQPAGSSDRRLISSIWQPIKDHHDAQAAQLQLKQADAVPPQIPASALQALADAIAAEVPQLTDSEALMRAQDLLTGALASRASGRDQALEEARAKVSGLAAASDRRRARLLPAVQPHA